MDNKKTTVLQERKEAKSLLLLLLLNLAKFPPHSRKCRIDQRGLRARSAKGGRGTILHARCKHGYIPNCEVVFRGKSGAGDYHNEMNSTYFMGWFKINCFAIVHPG